MNAARNGHWVRWHWCKVTGDYEGGHFWACIRCDRPVPINIETSFNPVCTQCKEGDKLRRGALFVAILLGTDVLLHLLHLSGILR